VRVVIGGNEVLAGECDDLSELGNARVRLRTGYNPVAIEYTSNSDRSGRLRLLWEHESFAREPVPPTVWFHRGDDAELQRAHRLQTGRELLTSLHCNRCHFERPAFDRPVPETGLGPPNLAGSGARLNREWIAQWLLDPRAHRPQATMPALFDPADPQSRQQAADVAAYLASLEGRPPTSPDATANEATEAQLATGERLYEQFACLACHRLTAANEADDYNRISLAHAAWKYRPGQLAEFLRSPQRHHQGTRMPDFQLSADESGALAAFIASKATAETKDSATLAGVPVRGRELFKSKHCVACHAVTEPPATTELEFARITIHEYKHGCLAETVTDRRHAPQYDLTAEQREALVTAIVNDAEYDPPAPAETAERLIRQFNCGACHSRDSEISPRQMITVDEGSGVVPDALPTLTWTGEKLRTDWLERFLAGERHAPLRPWLKARMPAFPAIAHALADGLRAQHGIAKDDAAFAPDPALVEVGSELAAPTALDCRQCHGVGTQEPRGDERTRIALGINFSATRERLRREYYDRFVLNPPRTDPALRMPIVAPDGKSTKVTTVFGGNASRQFDALWHYIESAPPHDTAGSQ
jgi:mono/diheme cytochrome c family protein